MKRKLFLLYTALIIASLSISQNKNEYQYKTFKANNDTLNYRLLNPVNFDNSTKYPLVLFMHGAGERGADNEAQLIHGSTLFAKKENREKYNSFVIFPQCDTNDYWSNISYTPNDKGLGFEFKENPKPNKSLYMVLKLLDSLVKHPNIDIDRIYVAGLSMGGMATFELLYHRPNIFAAAIPICGGANTKLASYYKKDLPIWIFHGSDDTVVNAKYSLDMVDSIIKNGGSPKFTLYDNTGHDSWNKAFNEQYFLEWLFSKSLKNK